MGSTGAMDVGMRAILVKTGPRRGDGEWSPPGNAWDLFEHGDIILPRREIFFKIYISYPVSYTI